MTASSDDEAAFADIFERLRDGVHAFLLAKTSDHEAAKDLLQEVFLRVWRRVDEVAAFEESRQRAWVFTVARNLMVDRYRSRATQRETVAALTRESSTTRAHHPDTAERAAQRDDVARLEQAITSLPDDQRVILMMVAMAGMTSEQIGAALDLPPGTVRYQLHQTRARLSRLLEGTP